MAIPKNDQLFYEHALQSINGIQHQPYRRYSPKDEYLMRRYQELSGMAYELCQRTGDIPSTVMALATLDVIETLRELPDRMPKIKVEQPNIDVRVIVDKIQALMSDIYKS